MTFTIVRHAHAGKRGAWAGVDSARPLSQRGQMEAKLIAEALRDRSGSRLLSSPALRCQETLAPLGAELGVEVEVDDRLFEGPRDAWLSDLILEACDESWVVCTHGDVIPVLLHLLIDDGLPAPATMSWHKASVWTIERRDGMWTASGYWRARA